MRRVLINDTAFNGVAAGQTASINLDPSGIYHGLDLIYKPAGVRANQAAIEADLGKIEILLNGTQQRQMTPAQVNLIEAFKGGTFQDGRIPIRFSENDLYLTGDENGLALGMAGISQFSIKVPIKSGVVDPQLDLRSIRRPAVSSPPGQMITYSTKQVEATAAGIKRETYFGTGRLITHIHCFTDKITSVKVMRGEQVLMDADKTTLDDLYVDHDYVPQSGVFHISPVGLSGVLADSLNLSGQVLKFEFTMSAADTFDMIFEELGPRKA